MINSKQIEEILSLYKKHGWNLRRVLLCSDLKNSLDSETLVDLFEDCEISETEFNAVWFSRPSKHQKFAWELRHLSVNPFALFEVSDDENLDEEIVKEMENRLKEYASKLSGNEIA